MFIFIPILDMIVLLLKEKVQCVCKMKHKPLELVAL